MALFVLAGEKGTATAFKRFCKEKDIPYFVLLTRNYKTLTEKIDYSYKEDPHKVLTTLLSRELLNYGSIWSDFTIDLTNGNSPYNKYIKGDIIIPEDKFHLADLFDTDQYIFVFGESEYHIPGIEKEHYSLLNDIYTIMERDGNLSNLRKVKAESNPIYIRMRSMFKMDWPAPKPWKDTFKYNQGSSST